MAKYLELRNICMIEPENDELVQVSYLCDMDSQIWEDELLNECGDIRSVGMANDKVFMSLGIYPVSINYEKDGTTVRARENSMLEFDWVEDNIYKPNKNGINLLCRMKHLKERAAGETGCFFFLKKFAKTVHV